jgi:hypothetical protein
LLNEPPVRLLNLNPWTAFVQGLVNKSFTKALEVNDGFVKLLAHPKSGEIPDGQNGFHFICLMDSKATRRKQTSCL